MTNPYKFDESYREHNDIECDKVTHHLTLIKYEGPLYIEICMDPKCAKVIAKCEHELPTEELGENGLRLYVDSICTWNDEGTTLTCQYCGKDVT